MRIIRSIKADHSFYFSFAGVIFGIAGTVLGVLGFLAARSVDLRQRRVDATQLVAEALDLLGGAKGTTSFFVPYPNSGTDLRNLEEARRRIDRALLLDPRSSRAYRARAVYLHAMGNHREASQSYERAIELDPDDAAASIVGLGNLLYDAGDVQAAFTKYREALEVDPRNAVVYYNMGESYFDQGYLKEASKAFARATELNKFDDYAYCRLGLALEYQDRIKESAVAYARSIELGPDREICLVGFSRVLLRLNEVALAVSLLRKAVTLAPMSASAHYTLANALRRQGSKDEAKKAFQRGDEVAQVNRPFFLGDTVWAAVHMEESSPKDMQAPVALTQ